MMAAACSVEFSGDSRMSDPPLLFLSAFHCSCQFFSLHLLLLQYTIHVHDIKILVSILKQSCPALPKSCLAEPPGCEGKSGCSRYRRLIKFESTTVLDSPKATNPTNYDPNETEYAIFGPAADSAIPKKSWKKRKVCWISTHLTDSPGRCHSHGRW